MIQELVIQFQNINWIQLVLQTSLQTIIFIIVAYFLQKHIIKLLRNGKEKMRLVKRFVRRKK